MNESKEKFKKIVAPLSFSNFRTTLICRGILIFACLDKPISISL